MKTQAREEIKRLRRVLKIRTTEVQEKVEPALVVAPVPVSAMGTKMTGLFGGHNLVNEKDLDTIQSNQADITSNMRLLSTMLRGQNAQSERIFKEASHELEELISVGVAIDPAIVKGVL